MFATNVFVENIYDKKQQCRVFMSVICGCFCFKWGWIEDGNLVFPNAKNYFYKDKNLSLIHVNNLSRNDHYKDLNKNSLITRMHSSKVGTDRSSSRLLGRGVSAPGVSAPRGCLLQGGCIPACTEADTPTVNRMTDKCKNITFANFVCGR